MAGGTVSQSGSRGMNADAQLAFSSSFNVGPQTMGQW